MGKRLMAALLAAALCLGLAGCGNGEEASSRPEEAAFSAEIWEAKRPKIALSLTEPDIVDTTFTHDDTGLTIARLLGQELIVYPRYARDLRKGYTLCWVPTAPHRASPRAPIPPRRSMLQSSLPGLCRWQGPACGDAGESDISITKGKQNSWWRAATRKCG